MPLPEFGVSVFTHSLRLGSEKSPAITCKPRKHSLVWLYAQFCPGSIWPFNLDQSIRKRERSSGGAVTLRAVLFISSWQGRAINSLWDVIGRHVLGNQ